jgi:hypothetical protein
MTDKDTALRLALEALKDRSSLMKWQEAITAIKASLEAKDEPPRFPTMLRKMWSGTEVQEWVNENWQAPPQRTWVGLNETECGFLFKVGMTPFDYYQAIEAKLKEKNSYA